ncbi:MAG: transcription elongation factor GreA [Myxococcota bacterium]|nr:transcription elongation factor GreA [Myxococcota bacterium]
MSRYPTTPAGLEAMRAELRRLREVERPKVVNEVEVAREHGDLSENAEYHAAKEKLGFIEGQIRFIEDKLSRVEVIDPRTLKGTRVVFGARVTYEDVDSGESRTYQIVGADESDPKQGRISIESPIARALIGKEEGDEVILRTPSGARTVEITEVRFS